MGLSTKAGLVHKGEGEEDAIHKELESLQCSTGVNGIQNDIPPSQLMIIMESTAILKRFVINH